MNHLLGLLTIHVHKGVNLAATDIRGSDPYVVFRLGTQVIIRLSEICVFFVFSFFGYRLLFFIIKTTKFLFSFYIVVFTLLISRA